MTLLQPRLQGTTQQQPVRGVQRAVAACMVNFGPLSAEICWRVWGTPANFNRFRVLAALLHGTRVVGVSQFAALNTGRHLHSEVRPSRWALIHILLNLFITFEFLQRCIRLANNSTITYLFNN